MDVIEVPLRKPKLAICMLIASFCALFGLWLLAFSTGQPTVGGTAFFAAIGSLVVLYAGPASFYFLMMLASKAPGLVMSSDGIEDHSSPFSVGKMSRADVLGITVRNYDVSNLPGPAGRSPMRYVLVRLNHPERYLARRNGLTYWLMRLRRHSYGAPVIITTFALDISFEELLNQVKKWADVNGVPTSAVDVRV